MKYGELITFSLGLMLGGAVGYYFALKKEEKERQKKMAEYFSRLDELETNYRELAGEYKDFQTCVDESFESALKEGLVRPAPVIGPDWEKAMREMYPDVDEIWGDEEEETGEYDEILSREGYLEKEEELDGDIPDDIKDAIEFAELTRDTPPEALTQDELDNLPRHLDMDYLGYYVDCDILVSQDRDEIIPNPHDVVGNCLITSGFANNNEDLLHVINYKYGTVYEIEKIGGPLPENIYRHPDEIDEDL